MQRFTVAFNFLCFLLGLLYEGMHLSLSVQRKITVNVFYSTFTNVFIFVIFFTFFNVFFIFGRTFFSSMTLATITERISPAVAVSITISVRIVTNLTYGYIKPINVAY